MPNGNQEKIKQAVRQIQANPAMLDELIGLPPGQRKQRLTQMGLGDVKRQDVQQQVQQLLSDQQAPPSAARAVEWVGALATLAAGALAA
jgi:hypothetical protein